jgi:hypothetical protein
VGRRWVDDGEGSFRAICVDYLESSGAVVSIRKDGALRNRVDYRERLSPADFRVFALLREVRNELAQAEAVPVDTILGDKQVQAYPITERSRSSRPRTTVLRGGD